MLITEKVLRPDTKGRIGVGAFIEEGLSGFRVSVDAHHRIILEPMIEKLRYPKSRAKLKDIVLAAKNTILNAQEVANFADDIEKARSLPTVPRDPWSL